jgi:glutaredoxin
MVRISGQRGVPVIVIDGDIIVGFSRRALEEKLR